MGSGVLAITDAKAGLGSVRLTGSLPLLGIEVGIIDVVLDHELLLNFNDYNQGATMQNQVYGNQISAEEVFALCPNKDAAYVICKRNQYILPPKRDPLVTKEFLRGVIVRHYWCLKSGDSKSLARVCADPPNKKILAEMLVLAMRRCMGQLADGVAAQGMMRTADLIKVQRPPCKLWMLTVLGVIEPGHPIFDRNYVKPRRDLDLPTLDFSVANVGGFFDGLPAVDGSKTRGRGRMNFMPKELKERHKIERLKARLSKDARRLALYEAAEAEAAEVATALSTSNESPTESSAGQQNPMQSSHNNGGVVSEANRAQGTHNNNGDQGIRIPSAAIGNNSAAHHSS